jgi:hypothetical protein
MTEIKPAAVENSLLLGLEDFMIDEVAAGHLEDA